MDEQTPTGGGTAFKVAGAGCSGMGCVLMLAAIAALGAVAAGAVNISLEDQTLIGGGSGLCCGILCLILGILLIVVGRSR